MFKFRTGAFAAACMSVVACGALEARAQSGDFYAGKAITLLIGSDVGGGYDVYARTIGRHLPRHIPGAPSVTPRNMVGAGSGTAAAAMFTTAPKDGTWIGAIFPGVIIGPILDPKPQTLFDPAKFIYIASADSGTRVCATGPNSKVKTFADAQKQKTIVGASAAGGSTRDYAAMLKNITGAQFEIVSGYKGTADLFLAIERGEVDGLCGLDWSSLKAQRPDWLRDKKINILVQVGLKRHADLPDVPLLLELATNDADRRLLEFFSADTELSRSLVTTPGVPADRVEALRRAFDAVVKDPDFLAEAAKSSMDISPATGEASQKIAEAIVTAPPDVIARAKQLMTP